MGEVGEISGVDGIFAGAGHPFEGLGDFGQQRKTGGVVWRVHRAVKVSHDAAEPMSELSIPSHRGDARATVDLTVTVHLENAH